MDLNSLYRGNIVFSLNNVNKPNQYGIKFESLQRYFQRYQTDFTNTYVFQGFFPLPSQPKEQFVQENAGQLKQLQDTIFTIRNKNAPKVNYEGPKNSLGQKHGYGTLFVPSDDDSEEIYNKLYGKWENDKLEGLGILSDMDDNVIYKGNFKNSKYDGEGTLIKRSPDGDEIYTGNFVDGNPMGKGVRRSNKEKYIDDGYFLNGNLIYGTRKFDDGTISTVNFGTPFIVTSALRDKSTSLETIKMYLNLFPYIADEFDFFKPLERRLRNLDEDTLKSYCKSFPFLKKQIDNSLCEGVSTRDFNYIDGGGLKEGNGYNWFIDYAKNVYKYLECS